MAARLAAALALAAALMALPAAGAGATSPPGRTPHAEARRVVTTFFTTLNARKYERTCALLADAYFDRTPGSSRRTCAIGLRTGFMWAQEIRWRITRVNAAADRALVDTVADGAPGRMVLERDRGRLRIVALTTGTS